MVNLIIDGVLVENFSPSVAKHFAEANDWVEIEEEDADDNVIIDCHFLVCGNLCGDVSIDTIKCLGRKCPDIQRCE